MTYRDDHDAALARAEALEREAAELREKAARLEAENEVLAKERAELAAQVEAPRRALARIAGEDAEARAKALVPRKPGALVSSALHAHTGLATLASASPLAAVGVAAVAGAAMPFTIATVAAIVVGLLMLRSLVSFDERRERRLLASLPLPLDIAAYLAYLDEPHAPAAYVTVRVELESEPDDAARAQIVRAVAHAQPDAKGRVDGAVLTVRSHAIQTEVAGRPDNIHIHRWVRRLIARALLPIAAAHPVRRITID